METKILHLKTTQINAFNASFKLMAKYISECYLCFMKPDPTINQKGGLYIRVFSSDRSKLFELNLDADKFEEFHCQKTKLRCGIDLKEFIEVLNKLNNGNELCIYVNKNSPHLIHLNNDTGVNLVVNVVDINNNFEPPMLCAQFTSHWIVDFYKYNECLCYLLKEYPDISAVNIKQINNNLIFSANNMDEISYTFEDESNSIANQNASVGTFEIKSLNLPYLDYLCNQFEIYFKNDFPLTFAIPVGNLGKMHILITPMDIN